MFKISRILFFILLLTSTKSEKDATLKKLAILSSNFMPSANPASLRDNPEFTSSVPAIIARYGFDCETHTIVSQGYILNVHRIPRPKNGKETSRETVILQHGVTASSFSWTLNGPDKSLAFVLANAGYDVWMPNVRGCSDGREHTSYKRDSKEFWNYSFHEIAAYDMPAVIDHIRQMKGNDTKIAYIGHSMGTTILFTMLSLRPEYDDKLSVGVMLAPSVFLLNMKFDYTKYKKPFLSNAEIALKRGTYEIFPKGYIENLYSNSINAVSLSRSYWNKAIFEFVGQEDNSQANMTVIANVIKQRNSISWKTLIHFSQFVFTGEFKQFDYQDREINRKSYGSDTPPEYDLKNVRLNMTLICAENDNVVSERDVYKLYDKLPNSTRLYKVPHPKFNHADFLWAVDAPRLVNDKVMEVLQTAMRGK